MYTISTDEQTARAEMFNQKLNAPETVTITIPAPLAELIAEAMLEYTEKRRNYPQDAQSYLSRQLSALRSKMNKAFPLTYNED